MTGWTSRKELHDKSGWHDRKIRDEINRLRKDPATMVVSSSHGKGYKIPSNVEEMWTCYYESKSRVKDEEEKQAVLLKAIRMMESVAKTEQLTFDF